MFPDDPELLPASTEGSYCVGPNDVWVAAAFQVYHFDGNAWSTMDFDVPVLAVWGTQTEVWAVGSVGSLWRLSR